MIISSAKEHIVFMNELDFKFGKQKQYKQSISK